MVKLARGNMNNSRGRQKPRPLFPPGELPLFGPPPAFMRRPPGPPPPHIGPPVMPRGGGGFVDYQPPPPPRMRPPPHLKPPHLRPPPPPPHRLRPPPHLKPPHLRPPPPPMPLLQAPVMPPRPIHFTRSRPMPRLLPPKKLARNMKKGKNKKNKFKFNTQKAEESAKTAHATNNQQKDEKILEGPWITDEILAEINKMNELKKVCDETKKDADVKLFNEQKDKVHTMARDAKATFTSSQPKSVAAGSSVEAKNGTPEQNMKVSLKLSMQKPDNKTYNNDLMGKEELIKTKRVYIFMSNKYVIRSSDLLWLELFKMKDTIIRRKSIKKTCHTYLFLTNGRQQKTNKLKIIMLSRLKDNSAIVYDLPLQCSKNCTK